MLNQPINLLERVVVVNNVSDLPEPVLTAGGYQITLEENVVYEFGAGMIDLGDNHFVITNGVKLRGQGLMKTALTTQLTTGIVFTCAGDNSSAVEFEHFQFLCSESDVQLFDISFAQRVCFTSSFWFHVGGIGRFENIDTLRADSTSAFVGFSAPMRMYGVNGAFILDRTGLINVNETPSPYIIYLEEGCQFNNIFQVAGCIVLGFAGTVGIGKHPSVTFTIFGIGSEESVYSGFNQFRGGLAPLENFESDIDSGVVKSRFNFGLRDTNILGSLYFNNPIYTGFSGVDSPAKAEGETTPRLLHGFGHAYNQLTYTLSNPIRCTVSAQAFIQGTAGDNITMYIAKNGNIDYDSACQLQLPTDGIMFATDGIYDVGAGDYFEIWLENNSTSDKAIVKHKASFLSVKQI